MRGAALLIAVGAALTLGSPGEASKRVDSYRLDPASSEVSAKVAFFGLASKTARFPDMTGGISIDPREPRRIDMRVTFDASTLTASDGVTRRRLKGEKFFWVERYPEIEFRADRMAIDSAREGRIGGTLTARGVTRPVVLEVTFDRPIQEMGGPQPVRIEARGEIDRTDFGMDSYRAIVGKTVKLRIDALMVPEG